MKDISGAPVIAMSDMHNSWDYAMELNQGNLEEIAESAPYFLMTIFGDEE